MSDDADREPPPSRERGASGANSLRIARLFSERVIGAEADLASATAEDFESQLFESEFAHVSRAVEKRRREFAAGRVCARRALRELGVEDCEVSVGQARQPLWPRGVIGSISHSDLLCAAVVARDGELRSVGLDIEEDDGLEPRLWRRILRGEEARRLRDHEQALQLAKVVFSAKECVYKCQFPLTQAWLGFHDVDIELDVEQGRFQVRFLATFGPIHGGELWHGRFLREFGHVVTALELENPAPGGP